MSTATLTDTLHELSDLVPERFKYEHECWYVFRWGTWRKVSLIARIDEDRIMGACLEECRERGWDYEVSWMSPRIPGDSGCHQALIWNDIDEPVDAIDMDSRARAIATALLEAIKSEAEK